jgi:hypothetical protein
MAFTRQNVIAPLRRKLSDNLAADTETTWTQDFLQRIQRSRRIQRIQRILRRIQ